MLEKETKISSSIEMLFAAHHVNFELYKNQANRALLDAHQAIGSEIALWVGGKFASKIFDNAWKDIFGDPIKDYIAAAVLELKNFIREAIAEQQYQQALREIDNCQDRLIIYLGAPPASAHNDLQSALDWAMNAARSLQDLGRAGHSGYMIATSLIVAILTERNSFIGADQSAAIRLVLNRAISHCTTLHNDWLAWANSRVTSSGRALPPPRPGGDSPGIIYRYTDFYGNSYNTTCFNGQSACMNNFSNQLMQARQNAVNIVTDTVIVPSQEVIIIWEQILSRY
jgi:hypothetical protein